MEVNGLPQWLTRMTEELTSSNIWTYIVDGSLAFGDIADIAIITFVIYQLMKLTKDTRASQVLKGFAVILFAYWLSTALRLATISWLLDVMVKQSAIVLVVLFQPEIRRALEQIGRGGMLEKTFRASEDSENAAKLIEEITRALLNLSKRKVGALIVVERKTGLNDVLETGTRIDAVVSAELLENIFEPNTPLHDGALVVRGDRVAAAGCFLQLTEDLELSKELGTRHRAAIGITESTDALSLIVSEETGIISVAQQGKLTRYLDARQLKELLRGVYGAQPRSNGKLFGVIKKRRSAPRE